MGKGAQSIKNYFFPTDVGSTYRERPTDADKKKNLSYYIAPIQFQRIKFDLKGWRESVIEAELPQWPQRVKMQRMFLDTGLNEHVQACVRKRKRLTLLRKFKICNDAGDIDEEATKLFQAAWFRNFLNHTLNSVFYGYSLIALGDIENDGFPYLDVIRRHNVSPDRLTVTAFVYSMAGEDFTSPEYKPWHVYVPTSTESGVGKCGYGLFYEIAKTEILLRNNTKYNADYQEVFGQPMRVAHTTKTEEGERGELERSLANMGSQAYIVLDDGQDRIELIESKNTGTAYQSYGDFEKRHEAKISKVILGHEDGMRSIPGKLGSGQGGDESPVQAAFDEIQVEDGTLCQEVTNNELLPRMRAQGFKIGMDKHFEFINDQELEEFREKEDKSNAVTADIAMTMAQAGLQMDPVYFQDRTGIPTKAIPVPDPGDGEQDAKEKNPSLKEKTKNRLSKFYNHVK